MGDRGARLRRASFPPPAMPTSRPPSFLTPRARECATVPSPLCGAPRPPWRRNKSSGVPKGSQANEPNSRPR
eukprot:5578669-Prymnesium_polylepis.1